MRKNLKNLDTKEETELSNKEASKRKMVDTSWTGQFPLPGKPVCYKSASMEAISSMLARD